MDARNNMDCRHLSVKSVGWRVKPYCLKLCEV